MRCHELTWRDAHGWEEAGRRIDMAAEKRPDGNWAVAQLGVLKQMA